MYLFGQEAAGGAAGGPLGMLGSLFPIILIFAIFYFVLILPAKKKQKQHQSMVAALKGGERVITNGGVYGTVTRVMDDRVEIEVDKSTRTKIQVTKPSISALLDPSGNEEKPK